ncbi:hypothetical protein TNCV_2787401 [Trichonephila clavipes]|uniref:non-specific serine/threonine protein kinase n=1 Tax=Trichonephila clavipes TaxID=2585209 RepID=A0A8X6VQ39_TRICX|nr:hypothetical protein TNCV_2787401 [Trichonephila clavipes]
MIEKPRVHCGGNFFVLVYSHTIQEFFAGVFAIYTKSKPNMGEKEENGLVFTYNLIHDLTFKKNFELLSQGSEAKVYKGQFLGKSSILKERFVKKYRHPDLDQSLTLERIRAEVRALNRCHEVGIKCPAIYFADLQSRCIILQEITNSITVKEHLRSILEKQGVEGIKSLTPLAHKIGKNIALMHKNELVHGDLTTSNILLKIDSCIPDGDYEVYFIDFGLAKRDIVLEDKAVDLYVLERAISSSHPNCSQFYAAILTQYMKVLDNQASLVAAKLEEVRQRGRKRTMVG